MTPMTNVIFCLNLRNNSSRNAKFRLPSFNCGQYQVFVDVESYGLVEIFFEFPENYPRDPPQVKIPAIFHPNVLYSAG